MTEENIIAEVGRYFVYKAKTGYEVLANGLTHAVVDSAFALTEDGRSLAMARLMYLDRQEAARQRGCA